MMMVSGDRNLVWAVAFIFLVFAVPVVAQPSTSTESPETPSSSSPSPFPISDTLTAADSEELLDAPSPAPSGDDGVTDQGPLGDAEVPAPSPLSGDVEEPPGPSPGVNGENEPSPTQNNTNAEAPNTAPQVEKKITSLSQSVEVTGDENDHGRRPGVAFAVIGAACLVGVGAFVHKKRRHNLRRSQFRYGGRIEML